MILFGAATANAIQTFLDELNDTIESATDFQHSERLLASIRSQTSRSINFHHEFNKLHVTFYAEVLEFEESPLNRGLSFSCGVAIEPTKVVSAC